MNAPSPQSLPLFRDRRNRGRRASDRGASRDRRSGRDRRSTPRGTPDRRQGPRRLLDRRKHRWMRTLLATWLCALCLAQPPMSLADSEQSGACLNDTVSIGFFGRARESMEVALTRCDGSVNETILDALSVHLRPRGTERPRRAQEPAADGFVAEGIRRLDGRLLLRLQGLANQWPGHKLVVVSAYRPSARPTSRHHRAEALDVRVVGVHRARVAEFARTMVSTGVGFYPESTYTHIDVRDHEAFWVDQSRPGRASRYAPQDQEDALLASALAGLPPEPTAEEEAIAEEGAEDTPSIAAVLPPTDSSAVPTDDAAGEVESGEVENGPDAPPWIDPATAPATVASASEEDGAVSADDAASADDGVSPEQRARLLASMARARQRITASLNEPLPAAASPAEATASSSSADSSPVPANTATQTNTATQATPEAPASTTNTAMANAPESTMATPSEMRPTTQPSASPANDIDWSIPW